METNDLELLIGGSNGEVINLVRSRMLIDV